MTTIINTTCPPRLSLRFAVPCRRSGCLGCTHAAEDDGTRCGDAIGFRLRIDDAGRIERACFEGEACSVALDMAERLADHCEGRDVEELRALGTEDGLRLYGEPIRPGRRECCLLAWSVLKKAVTEGPVEKRTPETRKTRSGE
jgi:NifU-like protein involved in Fe-S cluster formation